MHPGALLPLLRHGDGQPGLHHPRRHDGDPGARLRPRGDVGDDRRGALHGALRRPDDVHRDARAPDFADHDLSSLRTGIMAGATCPMELMKRCVDELHMSEVAICYGMTETSPVSCPDPHRRRPGPAHGHRRAGPPARRDQDRRPRHRHGREAWRAGRVLHTRLLRDARLLGRRRRRRARPIDEDGWMHTGDLAVMRDDGYCNIIGRIKDMVIRGGENVYPREIEEFLYTHPDIDDAQVIGVPDEKYGEELCAWIRMRAGADAAGCRRGAGVRIRQARALQDPPLCTRRRRVPDDGDREGAQGRNADRDGATVGVVNVTLGAFVGRGLDAALVPTKPQHQQASVRTPPRRQRVTPDGRVALRFGLGGHAPHCAVSVRSRLPGTLPPR